MNYPPEQVTMKARWVDGPEPGAMQDRCGNWFVPDGSTAVWCDELTTALGFCGCGSPELLASILATYLLSLGTPYGEQTEEQRKSGFRDRHDLDDQYLAVQGENAWLLCAYFCDALGWTEHGGSIYGAWRTPQGTTAMRQLMEQGA